MDESSSEILLDLELRLFRCSHRTSNTPTIDREQNPLHTMIESVIKSIERGDYIEVLSSEAARLVFNGIEAESIKFQGSSDSANQFYTLIETKIDSFLFQSEVDRSCNALLVMCIGVSAFLAFTQNSVTGPCKDFPSLPLPFLLSKEDKNVGLEWDIWACNQLMSTGSELLGKFSIPQYIVYAKMLLMKTKDISCQGNGYYLVGTRSISYWLSRLLLLQQRILSNLSSSLFDLLQVLTAETQEHFAKVENVKSYWGSRLHEGEASTIVSMAHLEAGIIEYTYGRVDHSSQHFETAEKACGLQLSVTGVLGIRTLHQVKATAQRVLVTNTIMPQNGDACLTGSPKQQSSGSAFSEDKLGSHSHETNEASDILIIPKLLENGNDAIGANDSQYGFTAALEAIQHEVILSRCLLIEKNSPDGEMQRWDMAPFIEAVDAQKISCFIIRRFCDILRVRWESNRSHTKERALMMMEKLVQSANESAPGVAERIHFSYGAYVPTIPALRKEYGELLAACGLIGEALKIFEDLELWDNLITCYCLLEKKAAAVELIKARLGETPNDPRLWCSLGDVTNTDSYYEKALEVSNNKSARAKRSLARSAYNRGEYETSKILWESALAINSLFPDGWFAFGAAALKARDTEKALHGFTYAVKLDPDNGEAWNNIACLHMIKKKNKEAFIAFKEALKFRRNSWQLWENYSQVALDIGNFSQALEATKMVLDMSNNKRVDANLLERIMMEMESRIAKHNILPLAAIGDPNCTNQIHQNDSFSYSVDESKCLEHGLALSRETDHLVELLGNILQQVIYGRSFHYTCMNEINSNSYGSSSSSLNSSLQDTDEDRTIASILAEECVKEGGGLGRRLSHLDSIPLFATFGVSTSSKY